MSDCLERRDASCPKKMSYTDYVKTIPVFFWRDPFDRIVFFIGYNTITPNVCGAKPVIYLYPREKLDVTVSLDWNTKHLISIPEYRHGWHVVAHPDGKLDIG